MEKKIPVKNLYLLLVISLGLLGLGVGSTYAIFTKTVEIENPIVLGSNLTYTSDVMETIDVTVPANSIISTTLNVTNSTTYKLNYAVWYLNSVYGISFGVSSGTPTGSLAKNTSTSVVVDVRNDTSKNVTITLGVSSSRSDIILNGDMKVVPNEEISSYTMAQYISHLYYTAPKTIVTNNSIEYNYASSVSLMNDRLGGTTSNYDGGNVRYYGADPDNYIYFNCSDYSNQTSDSCEKWRIVGVFDGKVKITRSESIGSYAYDTTSGKWEDSKLKKLLNNGTYYNNLSDESALGLIANVTWNLGGASSSEIYSNQMYSFERNTRVYSGWPINWTGQVAIIYASDYGYAQDFRSCSENLYNYDSCNDSWLLKTQFVLNHNYSASDIIFADVGGGLEGATLSSTKPTYPTLYLNADVLYGEKGNGTSSNPYQISVQNITATEYVINLYNNAAKSVVTNNKIEYNYATGAYVMNDRLGGTTADYDGGNIRYYGPNPNNYIYFNCSDYSNQTSSTCERWRIIGVFDGKVKIISEDSIDSRAWDNKNTSTGAETDNGKNDWSDSSLMKMLNPGYESETSGSSIYNNWLSNDITGDMIAEVTWNIGGWNTSEIYVNQAYAYERGTTVYSGRATTWTGKIALPYPSDYGYSFDLQYCTDKLYYLDMEQACAYSSWLNPNGNLVDNTYWLLMHNSGSSYMVWVADYDSYGSVRHDYAASDDFAVMPVLYLNSDVMIGSGNGTSTNPFKIMVS